MKSGLYREEGLVLWAARRLGRPVRWTSTRAEAFLADEQARDVKAEAELALDADGTFLALRVRCDLNVGAYLTGRSMPLLRNIGGIAGVYRTPHIHAEVRGILTNTAQTAAYRGAGRPEATYILERTVDIAARELGLDPFEVRMRNLIPPEKMPFRTGLVFTYDCGEFATNMGEAARLIDRAGFPARREAARSRGKLRGLGFVNPIEVAGGPYGNPGKDMSRIVVGPDGAIMLACGIMSSGQGLETAMTQLVAARLGIPPDRIRYAQGDTDTLPIGRGSGGSSSLSVGGAAVTLALDRLLEKAKARASEALEAASVDLEFSGGAFRVVGSDRSVTLQALAQTASGGDPEPLSAEAEFQPPDVTFPNGCHACEVEIDPETGKIELVGYAAVEDVGKILNPALVEGQMHGGIAQGFGQAVKEAILHDSAGEVLTGTFNDYAMPGALDLLNFVLAHREVPTAVNPLGAKGVGEAGTVGALAAVMNAICDALAEIGIRDIAMPATPERVWAAIQAARRPSPPRAG
jgi:carbon-monoxide dehydrogenase large subunit